MFDIELPAIDLAIIALYFLIVLSVGFYFRRKAAMDMESYFLGSKSLPWWMLGLSGSVSNFDITGTMWLVSLIFLFGLKAFWIFWIYAFLIGAFLMSYMGRWIRRTNVMTAVELIRVRFGIGRGGKTARTAAGIMQVTFLLFAVGYAFQGIGKFVSAYLPFTPFQCAAVVMGITTLYVVVGGFRSVIVTDLIQAVILNLGGLVVAVLAFIHVDPKLLHEKMSLSLLPPWRIPEVAGTDHAGYEMFGLLCVVWVFTGIVTSIGGAGGHYQEQRFLATRNTKEAAKAGASWPLFLIFRWAMVAGIVFMALTAMSGVDDPERVLPFILKEYMPAGLRGVVLAGLIAAFMSTFSSTLNAAASIVVRDLVQPFWPRIRESGLIRLSYLTTVIIVVVGLLIGTRARSIDHIWIWMTTGLNACILIPNALRWYWWRMNGWGYAIGIFSGMLLSLMVLFRPDTPGYVFSPVINGVALAGCIVGSLLFRPVDRETIVGFFCMVKPKGFWGPVRAMSGLSTEDLNKGLDKTGRVLINPILGMVFIFCMNILPFFVIGRWYLHGAACLGVLIGSGAALYFTWFRPLSSEPEES